MTYDNFTQMKPSTFNMYPQIDKKKIIKIDKKKSLK